MSDTTIPQPDPFERRYAVMVGKGRPSSWVIKINVARQAEEDRILRSNLENEAARH